MEAFLIIIIAVGTIASIGLWGKLLIDILSTWVLCDIEWNKVLINEWPDEL